MAKVMAYGDITITDLTDVGRLSSYLTSSQPLMVVYDPNSTPEYSPNWQTNNLILTPKIFFNDTELGLTASGLTISWQRQAGSGSATSLVSGETASNGVLTVSKNILADTSIVTYICNVSYVDPNTNGVTIKTQSQMSFSLVKNAPELKDCSITGDTTFKYNGEGTLISSNSITLTGNLTNTTIQQWQYEDSNGDFTVYPNSTASTTLTVNATDDVFVNDVAVIKLVTADSNVFDIHQIVKLRDGAAGSSTITCHLSNDSQSVPCNSKGELYSTSLNGCDTIITILKGADDDTNNGWNITATPSSGITGTYDSTAHKYTVTGITVEAGYVEFICSKSGYTTITKRFSIYKERSGADGNDAVFYSVSPDVGFVKLNKDKVYVPSSIIFSASKVVGNSASSTYSGRFIISESTDGSTYAVKYTSGSDEYTKTYTPSSNTVKTIKCELYESGNTTKLLDTQTVAIVYDGEDGASGAAGKDSLNVVLGNSAQLIPCTTAGLAVQETTILIPYDCYQGITRVAGTATLGTLPTGVTLTNNQDATASAGGLITLTVAKNAQLSSSSDSGDVTIIFTSQGLTSTHKFTWTKNKQAEKGENAVIFQILAPTGSVISKNLATGTTNSVTLDTQLQDGTTTVTSGISYKWSKYTGTSYSEISGQTSKTLTVTEDMVESWASFRCVATYNGNSYSAYWCVTDKQDPISVSCFSTLGEQLINGVGIGAVYACVYQNNQEIDALKTTVFSTTAPSNPSSGDFYYKLNSTAKTATLMKYSGSSWSEAGTSDLPSGTYSWYRRDSEGNILDTTTPYATGKVIYLDNTVVDGKIVFTCQVEI